MKTHDFDCVATLVRDRDLAECTYEYSSGCETELSFAEALRDFMETDQWMWTHGAFSPQRVRHTMFQVATGAAATASDVVDDPGELYFVVKVTYPGGIVAAPDRLQR